MALSLTLLFCCFFFLPIYWHLPGPLVSISLCAAFLWPLPLCPNEIRCFFLFWYYTIQSYLWQNYFLKSLAKGRRLTSRCTLQQKCPYFSLHLCLSFIPLAASNLNPELDMTIVLQLVSVFFSMLNPSYRLWNTSSFYDHLLKLIQKSDNSSPELPQWPKHLLMIFFFTVS